MRNAPPPATSEPGLGPICDMQIEQSLLGAFMINGRLITQMPTAFGPEHFHDPVHARVYDAIRQCVDSRGVADPRIIAAELRSDRGLADLGGAQYLANLVAATTTPSSARVYAEQLLELSQRRSVEAGARAVMEIARDRGQRWRDASGSLDKILAHMSENAGRTDRPVSQDAAEFGEGLVAAIEGRRPRNMRFGLSEVDRWWRGARAGDMVVVAGRPSMGKTTFGMQYGIHRARLGDGVLVISLEMSSQSLFERAVSMQTFEDAGFVSDGAVPYAAFESVSEGSEIIKPSLEAAQRLAGLPLITAATDARSPDGVRDAIRRTRRKLEAKGAPLRVVILDYLQLVRPDALTGNRVSDMTSISNAVKEIAVESDVAMIALSQLSRAVENRDDKRPQLADLRETGAIEQDADSALFLYREEYYLRRAEPREATPEHAEWRVKMDQVKGKADIIIAKQRNGPIGTGTVLTSLPHSIFYQLGTSNVNEC